jgi:hypothetical protein
VEITDITIRFMPGYVYDPVSYEVKLDSAGTIKYRARVGWSLDGHKGEPAAVEETKHVAKAEVENLFKTIDRSRLDNLKANYDEHLITDQAYFHLEAKYGSRKKEVKIYGGHIADLEDLNFFHDIFKRVQEFTQVDEWIAKRFEK